MVLLALNLSILDAGILIMVEQVRLMMYSLNMVDYPMSLGIREGFKKKVGIFPKGGGLPIWAPFPTFLKFIFIHGLNHPEMQFLNNFFFSSLKLECCG